MVESWGVSVRGGIGLEFTEHYAKTQSVNLILTGRSELSPEKKEKIKQPEAQGSKVFYLQADVSDAAKMKQGVAEAKTHFGSVDGVIHAAGILSEESILAKDFQVFEKVLSPKIQGTLVLDDVLKTEPLKFICYFSSSSAILGDFGSCMLWAIVLRWLTPITGINSKPRDNAQDRHL